LAKEFLILLAGHSKCKRNIIPFSIDIIVKNKNVLMTQVHFLTDDKYGRGNVVRGKLDWFIWHH